MVSHQVSKSEIPRCSKIKPLDEGGRWEEAIDFTKLRRGGIDIDDLLTQL